MDEKRNVTNNTDRQDEEQAFRRAEQQAREIAARTGTPLVTYREGKVEKRAVDATAATNSKQAH